MSQYHQALRAAAVKKGSPLTTEEREQVYRNSQYTREQLRERFIKVIRLAGYLGDAPERICAEWLDKYMQDVPSFLKMMERYEAERGDPID